jgi:hypothetical protein
MARQGIFTGSSPNDGTGDSLLVGASKINQNFSDIYSAFGDGNNLVSYANTAGVSTSSQGLTGTPNITVNRIVAGLTSSLIPFYWENFADLPSFSTYHGAFAHVHETGKAYYAHSRWVELVNTETDRTVGTGTENYKVGVITATSFVGDGSQLTGIGTNSGGSGIALTSLSVTVNAVGLSTLSYNNSTGVFAFTPPNLTGYATTGSIVGFITSGALTGFTTAGALVGFITSGALTGFTTAGALVGFITAGALTGYATTSSIVGFITSGALTGFATQGALTSLTINDLADVNAGGPSTGQVLKWSGTEWNAAADLTAAGGSGIGLTDLSVTVNSVGVSTLSYNNATGVFAYTPPNLTGYATTSSIVGFITSGALTGFTTAGALVGFITAGALTGYATTSSIVGFITSGALTGFITGVNITAGSNITVLETSEGNFIITSTSSGSVGTGSTWSVNSAGIHTSKNVGIGTTISSSALTVEGDGRFSGIVTASSFQSSSSGTPTINSPSTLVINASTVAISTNLTVGGISTFAGITTVTGPTLFAKQLNVSGVVTASSFSGSGSGLSSIPAGQLTGSLPAINGSALTNLPAASLPANGSFTTLSVSGITTSASFRTNSTVGDGTDVGFAIKYYITANGSSAYRFAGPGVLNTTDDPTIYLHRGFTYIFENSTGGSHPFAIRYSSGGTGYGSTYLSGSQTGTQIFTVPFDAPPTLVYQCTIHGSMLGTFNIVT